MLVAHGRFSVSLGEVTDAGPDTLFDTADDVTYQAMVLELGDGDPTPGTDPVEVFIGVGGELDDKTTATYADDTVENDGGIGVFASLESLTLVSLKNNNGDVDPANDLSYMGLRLAGFGGELVGIDGLTFGIYDGLVLVNQAKDAAAPTVTPDKIDWTSFGTFHGASRHGYPDARRCDR